MAAEHGEIKEGQLLLGCINDAHTRAAHKGWLMDTPSTSKGLSLDTPKRGPCGRRGT